MVGALVRVAADPARRFVTLWRLVAFAVSMTFIVIGGGYAVAGGGAIRSHTLDLIADMEPGGLHTHGVVLILLGAALAYFGHDYGVATKIALVATLFYSSLVTVLIFMSWIVYGVTWGAPWWYLLTSTLTAGLVRLAPPTTRTGRHASRTLPSAAPGRAVHP